MATRTSSRVLDTSRGRPTAGASMSEARTGRVSSNNELSLLCKAFVSGNAIVCAWSERICHRVGPCTTSIDLQHCTRVDLLRFSSHLSTPLSRAQQAARASLQRHPGLILDEVSLETLDTSGSFTMSSNIKVVCREALPPFRLLPQLAHPSYDQISTSERARAS